MHVEPVKYHTHMYTIPDDYIEFDGYIEFDDYEYNYDNGYISAVPKTVNAMTDNASGLDSQILANPQGGQDIRATQAIQLLASRIPRLPTFFRKDPEFWFQQLESTFALHGVTQDDTKFGYIMANATDELQPYLAGVCKDPIPEGSTKYQLFKTRVIQGFSVSEEARLKKLFSGQCLGNMTPSQFLSTLRSQAPTACGETVMKTLFMEQLPDNVKTVLAVLRPDATLDELAKVADKVMEQNPVPVQIAKISTTPSTSASIQTQIDALSNRLDDLILWMRSNQQQQSQGQQRPRDRSRSRSRSRQRNQGLQNSCYYHAKFGKKANQCKPPCVWAPEN